MLGVLLGGVAGASFGALAVAVRWGIDRRADPFVGALVTATIGALIVAIAAIPSVATDGLPVDGLWPFLFAGVIAPGSSQVVLTLAVQNAGPSRTAILLGAAPVMSSLIAMTILNEPFRVALLVGTILIVVGSGLLVGEKRFSESYKGRGLALALLCAALFATRDVLVRAAAQDAHPPPLIAAATSLLAAVALILSCLVVTDRSRLRTHVAKAVPAFAPAGLAIGLGYAALLAALDQAPVTVVSPLNATGSLWALLLAAAVQGRRERIDRRRVSAALLIVAGGGLIGASR